MQEWSELGEIRRLFCPACSWLSRGRAFIRNTPLHNTLHVQQGLRPGAIILMGKNTMMKRSIKLYCETTGDDKWLGLLDKLVYNVGIIFTNGDLNDVKEEIAKYKVRSRSQDGTVHTLSCRHRGCVLLLMLSGRCHTQRRHYTFCPMQYVLLIILAR